TRHNREARRGAGHAYGLNCRVCDGPLRGENWTVVQCGPRQYYVDWATCGRRRLDLSFGVQTDIAALSIEIRDSSLDDAIPHFAAAIDGQMDCTMRAAISSKEKMHQTSVDRLLTGLPQ